MNQAKTISAIELAKQLGEKFSPTLQQQHVIEAPMEPALVVAGAGSGKTTTMADRVRWLVVNSKVEPDQVLGLTFTRKASHELAERIKKGLNLASRKGLIKPAESISSDGLVVKTAQEQSFASAGYEAGATSRVGLGYDEFHAPTVSTYNSFANTIFRENALILGFESEVQILDSSSAWNLARRVVLEHGSERLAEFGSVRTLTDKVLSLSSQCRENEVEPEQILEFSQQFQYLNELEGYRGKNYKLVDEALANLEILPDLIVLVQKFQELKQQQQVIEYSDQVAFALKIINQAPEVAEELRARYKVVILDEYQDTSVLQTRLLAKLFAQQAVMAVGDPNQSIYGWRGASASNLAEFYNDFGVSPIPNPYQLNLSWRNDEQILNSANQLIEPLTKQSRVPVLQLGARPKAELGELSGSFYQTVVEEAAAVADWFQQQLQQWQSRGETAGSMAILFRAKSKMNIFAEALHDKNISYQILGLGGLLQTPEIADLTAVLRVLHDPYAGSALIRILSGAKYRIGVKDLFQLRALAKWLEKGDFSQTKLPRSVQEQLNLEFSSDLGVSIIDALDFIAVANPRHLELAKFSQAGLDRLRQAAEFFSELRKLAPGLTLAELVRVIIEKLQLDIEAESNESSFAASNLSAFENELYNFIARETEPGLANFLHWLDRAENQDDLAQSEAKAVPGTVQLLTVHASKGLEWDKVAVPRLVQGEFPGSRREGDAWLRFGELPYELRGDSKDLAKLVWRNLDTQKDFVENHKQFKAELDSDHQLEERRLAYVAVTRARSGLFLSGAYWDTALRPRVPSEFYQEILGEAPALISAENPLAGTGRTLVWPQDPLGDRRAKVVLAAQKVTEAKEISSEDAEALGRWAELIELLLAEQLAKSGSAVEELPFRIPASSFKDFVTKIAEQQKSLVRPLPTPPKPEANLGTIFHSWVELLPSNFGSSLTLDLFDDEAYLEAETTEREIEDSRQLKNLKENFLASKWGGLKPYQVEQEIQLPLAGQLVICKIDAIYQHDSGFEIVDWKTGRVPRSPEELAEKSLQLSLYRLAFSELNRVPLEQIEAVFYYVADDRIVEPNQLLTRVQLEQLWKQKQLQL